MIMNMAMKKFFIGLLPLLSGSLSFAQADTITRVKKDTMVLLNPAPGYKTVVANPDLKGNGMKIFLVGRNYRKEWIEPVKVPVLDLATEQGGLTPKKEGGGKETRSLQVEDAA